MDDGTELRNDELLQKMLRILSQAVAKPEVAEQMKHEDVLQKDLERSLRKLEVKISELTEQNEEERRQKEEERRQKEKERRQKEEERRQKEEERRQKEEAQSKLASAYNKLRAKGIGETEALDILNLTTPPSRK